MVPSLQETKSHCLKKKIPLRLGMTIILFLSISTNFLQAGDKKTIAIDTFKNLTDNREIDWIGIGFAETLSTKLANIETIQVVERTRMVELLKEIKLSIDGLTDEKVASQAGRFIGAEYMILGSFQKVANQVMVNARIVDVESGKVQKSASAKGEWENLFDIQEELALKLAEALGTPATESERVKIAEKPAENLTAYEWFAKGNQYFGRLEYDKAIEAYGKALEIQPQYAEAYCGRAFGYCGKSRFEAAIRDSNKAISLNPQYALAYMSRGAAYFFKGDYERAIIDYDRAIAIDPEDADAYTNRGTAYSNKGDYERAIIDYDRAIALEPGYPFAYKARGVTYAKKGFYERALVDLDKAIALNPEDAEAYKSRGLVYDSQNLHRRAIIDYDRAIAIDPDYAQAYGFRANTYAQKGLYEHAIIDYDRAIALNPEDPYFYTARGWAYYLKGDSQHARSDWERAITLDPYGEAGRAAREALLTLK